MKPVLFYSTSDKPVLLCESTKNSCYIANTGEPVLFPQLPHGVRGHRDRDADDLCVV